MRRIFMKAEYIVICNSCITGEDENLAYGMAYCEFYDGFPEITDAVIPVSRDRGKVEDFALMYNRMRLSDIRFHDAVAGFIADIG